MVSILSLILLFVTISFTTAYPWSGLNICDAKICHGSVNRPTLDVTRGFNAVNVACTNLVGSDGSFSFVSDERRHVCYQVDSGDNPYRYDYDVHRNKCPEAAMTLDFHSCRDIMTENLNNTIWCGGNQQSQAINCGQRRQVGCFDVYASPQPGLCAGTLPYVV